jgi:cell division protein FtsZ
MAKEMGVLTVAVVTKPFHFEGTHRMKLAEAGLEELQKYVDTMIVIPNQNLFRIANEKTTFADAFRMADEVLHSGVRGVTDLMIMPGLINLDFADIRAVMREMGKAMMGTGEAHGERRAVEAAEAAISNPLLDDVSMKGARGVLINITGGSDMTLFEVDEAANRIRDEVDPDANIIFGSTFNEALQGRMRISVVATGIDQHQFQQRKDTPSSSSSNSRQEESNRTSRFSQRPEMMSSGFAPKVTTSQTQEAESATYNNSQREESRHFTPPASVVAENQPVEAAVPSPAPAQGVRGVRSMGRHSPTRLETARSASEQADDYYTPQPAVSAAPLMQQPNVTETRPARGIRPTRASASHAQQPDLWQQAEDETQPSFFQRMTARFTTKEEEEQHQPSRRAEVVGTRQSAKPAMSQSEDYLEIPAFLRRQAN